MAFVAEAFQNALEADSVQAVHKAARGMWTSVCREDDPDAQADVSLKLSSRVVRAILAAEDALHIPRVAAFLGQLAANVDSTGKGHTDLPMQVLEDALCDIPDSCNSKLGCARLRACQFIHAILSRLPRPVSPQLADSLQEVLLQRLDDKDTKVRRTAVQAVCSLLTMIQDEDAAQVIRDALAHALDCERTQGVRVAIVSNVPVSDATLDMLLGRTLDVAHEVRSAVYKRLQQYSASVLSIQWRVRLVTRGLQDRVAAVQQEAAELVGHWLREECGDDPVQLLKLLEPELHQDGALLALDAALTSARSEPSPTAQTLKLAARLKREAETDSLRLRCKSAAPEPVTPEWALYREAQGRAGEAASSMGAAADALASQAAALHDALEAFLPDATSAMCDLIAAQVEQDDGHWFAAMQLLHLTGICMDWTDHSGRQAALELVEKLIMLDPRCQQGCDTGAHLAALGGDDRWEGSVVGFLRAVCGSDQDCLGQLQALVQAAAQRWCLQRVGAGTHTSSSSPSLDRGDAVREVDASAPSAAASSCLLQCLAYTAHVLALAAVVPGSYMQGVGALVEGLVLPGMCHGDARVRVYAARCLAAAGLVHGLRDQLPRVVALLCTALNSDTMAVQREAAAGLCKLVVVYGQKAVDGALLPLTAPGEGRAEDGGWEADESGSGAREGEGEGEPVQGSRHGGEHVAGAASGGVAQPSVLPRSVVLRLLDKCKQLVTAAAGKSGLDEEVVGLVQVVSEGLQRLMVHQELQLQMSLRTTNSMHMDDRVSQQVLAQLLVLQVHPASEQMPAVRQGLVAFFEDFVRRSPLNRGRLCECLLQAVHCAVQLGPPKATAVPLIKYGAQLLAATTADSKPADQDAPARAAAQDDGRMELALRVLLWLERPPTLKSGPIKAEVHRELAKLLLVLAPKGVSSPKQRRSVRAALVLLERCVGSGAVADSATLAALKTFRGALEEAEEEEPGEGLSEDQLSQLVQTLSAGLDLGGTADDDQDSEEDAPPKRRVRDARKKPAASRRAPTAAARKSTRARAAPVPAAVETLEDDDDSSDESV